MPEVESGYMDQAEWAAYQVFYVHFHIARALRWLADKVDPSRGAVADG